jgi:hypothetical protein
MDQSVFIPAGDAIEYAGFPAYEALAVSQVKSGEELC